MNPRKIIIYTGVLTLTVLNLTNSLSLFGVLGNIKVVLFLLLHLVLIVTLSVILYRGRSEFYRFFNYVKAAFENAEVPKVFRYFVGVIIIGNMLSIAFAKPIYPFYDVGMFRGNSKFENEAKIVTKPKYFYWKDGKPEILDIRKECLFFLAEHWGWGYSQEFTFAAAFHNKGQKENFDFLASKMESLNIDSLWVGVHYVDFASQKVWFETDLCKAIEINQSQNIHYGPIYIPMYQKSVCND